MEGLADLVDLATLGGEGPSYIVSIEQRDEDDTLLDQALSTFASYECMEVALCQELCDQLCEHFDEHFRGNALSGTRPGEALSALMYYDWRKQRLSVREPYSRNIRLLLDFATAHMRTASGKHPLVSIVIQRSESNYDCERMFEWQ